MHRYRLIALGALLAIPIAASCGSSGDNHSSGSSSGAGGGSTGPDGGPGGGSPDGGPDGGPAACQGTGPSGNNPYKVAYFGDLHLHTSYSLDAYSFGTRSDPANAYLFAKGSPSGVVHVGVGTTGMPGPDITQPRALDFLAVTDHSEFLAVTHGCVLDQQSGYYNNADCGLVRSETPADQDKVFAGLVKITTELCGQGGDPAACAAETHTAWEEIIKAANDAYVPCQFTSLVAYEWTDQETVIDQSDNMSTSVTDHRNVIFGSDKVPDAPLNALDYATPPALWTGLDKACDAASGCDVITIPHNSNLSAGVSLKVWDPSPAGVAQQERYQVAVEVYQHKGSSECYYSPAEGYDDADCQFEYVTSSAAVNPQPSSFIRSALESGISYEALDPASGNPLKLGFVGATDDHNGAPGNVDEARYVGHVGQHDDGLLKRLNLDAQFGGGALTGVWAEQNTRESIFAAVKRRETFATSGPRMQVRFYQTADAAACADPAFPKKIVDASATPMGGTFGASQIGQGNKPTFAISAWPDAQPQDLENNTNAVAGIEAVQIIKAHVATGKPSATEDKPIAVVGIPATGGCATWTDPNFDASEHAFYYVRVLQQPTWRWSHHDCEAAKKLYPNNWQNLAAGCATGLDTAIRERAWTSPIWFVPG